MQRRRLFVQCQADLGESVSDLVQGVARVLGQAVPPERAPAAHLRGEAGGPCKLGHHLLGPVAAAPRHVNALRGEGGGQLDRWLPVLRLAAVEVDGRLLPGGSAQHVGVWLGRRSRAAAGAQHA